MYKVNGWFLITDARHIKVSNGDSIAWCYTCKGLGEDLGLPECSNNLHAKDERIIDVKVRYIFHI